MKTKRDKSACVNVFLKLPFTNSSIILEWMQHYAMDHTLTYTLYILYMITYTSYIAYTYNYNTATCNIIQKQPPEVFLKILDCKVIKKRLLNRCFPVKFEKFLRSPILKNICERLLLCIDYFIIYWFLQFTTVHVFPIYK